MNKSEIMKEAWKIARRKMKKELKEASLKPKNPVALKKPMATKKPVKRKVKKEKVEIEVE
jgi:hypothetical protein